MPKLQKKLKTTIDATHKINLWEIGERTTEKGYEMKIFKSKLVSFATFWFSFRKAISEIAWHKVCEKPDT